MDTNLKVTDTPQETSFYDLVSGDNVLTIPMFQRPYRWSKKNLDWLLDDISQIQSGISKSCFLGVIVCVSRGTSPGRPQHWEIVDGQQRLSTLYLILMACAEASAVVSDFRHASGILGTYLLVRPMSDNPFNTKLLPAMVDRGQFNKLWDDLTSVKGLREVLSDENNLPRCPSPSGLSDGAMNKQFKEIRKYLKVRVNQDGIDWLKNFVQVVANQLSVVSITLRDPLVAPKIFERLNNRAELVTVADLVRNEVFALSAPTPDGVEYIFTNHWEPFVDKLKNVSDGLEKFLFPYGLIINKQVTKADLFSTLRSHWKSFGETALIIKDMERFVSAFLFLESGIIDNELEDEALKVAIKRFHNVGHPSVTFSFLIRLIVAIKEGNVPSEEGIKIFGIMESFLFRRGLCGIEPTGLHAGFKVLWSEITEGVDNNFDLITAKRFRDALSKKPTITWPSDQTFSDAIRNADMYSKRICRYAMYEFELAEKGESPSDTFEVEHICPQKISKYWDDIYGENHRKIVNTWANLIPLTPRMNKDAGQNTFDLKSQEYSQSIFATTRAISKNYSSWELNDLENRQTKIVEWALQRWSWSAF